jgi:outer membrane protein
MNSGSRNPAGLGRARFDFGVSVGASQAASPPRAASARCDDVTTLPPARHAAFDTPALQGASQTRRALFLFFRRAAFAAFAAIGLLAAAHPASAAPLRVAVVTDGPADRAVFSIDKIARQATEIGGADVEIRFPTDKRFAGDWSLTGANAALQRALADPQVDAVVTLGMLVSHEAAHRVSLPKPVIAPFVADPMLQGYPLATGEGVSGRKNFAYMADFRGIEDDVKTFHDVVRFKHLAALVDSAFMTSIPELGGKATEIESELGIKISIVLVGEDLSAAVAGIPADADAVYVTGLQRHGDADVRALADALIARRLPSFSVLGKTELDDGLLMTTGGAERDSDRAARRVALMLERIGRGEDPGTFEVGFPAERRVALNMRTAQALGFSPGFQVLLDAEQLHSEAPAARPRLTLRDAMREALAANPALAASRARLESSADDTLIARSSLLPSIDLSATRTQIDADRASALQAERTTTADLSLQQIVYSERVWANYSIARSLHEADSQGVRQDLLDTLDSAASGYLDVLRAQSVENVRRSNVENTRKNLETSRVREAVGVSQRSDYLRWVSQLAQDKQSLLSAEASTRQAETSLARVLHRGVDRPFAVDAADVEDPLAFVSSVRVRAFFDTPARWATFMDYVVDQAVKQAPEIAQADAVIASRQRALTSAKRAPFVPDIALVAGGSNLMSRNGVGSTAIPGGPDDTSWNVAVQASLPLFTGRRRAAELSQARHELTASEADRASASDGVAARARVALERTSASFPSIALSMEAEAAASENLASVTDAYARGAVSVTDLIDAQNAALSAGLAAADAKYGFLLDFVAVLRAMSEFELLLDPASRERWIQEVNAWMAQHGAAR